MLILEAMEPFELLKATRETDGEGGGRNTWDTDSVFMAAIVHQSTGEIRRAETEHLSKSFSVFTDKAVQLQHQAVIRRCSDGKTFRITSDGRDRQTPACASFSFARVTAEEWELT